MVKSDGFSISYLRQKAKRQKARKLGLSGLLASFPHINFAHLIGQIYVFFRVLNDAFPRGKKSGLMHVVAQGGGGKRTPFCRRKAVKCTCQQKLDTQILRLDMGKRNYGQGMRKPVQAIRHLLTEPERNAGHKCRR